MTILSPDFITEAATSENKKLKVLIVGAGGTGSELASKLFKMHMTIKALGGAGLDVTIMDDDEVSPSNIGRQAFWLCDIGQPKASVLVNRFNNFGGTNWKAVARKFEKQYLENCVVFGCVDNAKARIAIHDSFCHGKNVVWVDCGNDSTSANIFMGVNAMTSRVKTYIPSIFDLFKAQLQNDTSEQEPSCSTAEAISRQDAGVNDAAAQQAMQFLWQLYRHGKISYHGVAVDLKSGSTTPFAADPEIWALFGYVQKSPKKAA